MEPIEITEDEMWWDGDMRKKDSRTLLGWKLAGGQADKRNSLLGAGWFSNNQSRADRRRTASMRSRTLAEQIGEGISGRHDQNLTSPFSRAELRRRDGVSWLDFWRAKR
jgi:hypothetical protein